ncbi:D-tyrosyl-tRNA(Tyr) deacylase [Microbotryomycetes sp. JL221]|nr:D-tyrosyl-tRNA(Tyr) deacylase [Microbotryomycetes sp. JL221]
MVRAVIQRVKSASVTVDGQVISSINRGMLALIGIATTDTSTELDWLVKKLLNLKLFPQDSINGEWGWKQSIMDCQAQVLCVSQFTLYANMRKGSKPDFHAAMPGEQSKTMYLEFLNNLRNQYRPDKIFDGEFGAMMDVSLINDGPVTIILDSSIDAPKNLNDSSNQNQAKLERKLQAQKMSLEKQRKREQVSVGQVEMNLQQSQSQTTENGHEGDDNDDKGQRLAERFKQAMSEQY